MSYSEILFGISVLQELKHGLGCAGPKMCLRRGYGSGLKHESALWCREVCFKS